MTPEMAAASLGSTSEGSVDPGGVESARAASEEPKPGDAHVGSSPAPVDPSLALIGVSEVLLSASVRMSASRKRLKWNADLERLSRLSAEERATLGIFGPMAAPMFERSLATMPWVGSVAFGFVFLMVLSSRRKEIDAMAPPAATSEPPSVDDSERSPPGPAEAVDHANRWGNASDAVPVGMLPVDSGKFPQRKVESE